MSTAGFLLSPASACRPFLGTLLAASVFVQATFGTASLAQASAPAVQPSASSTASSAPSAAAPDKAASLQQIERDFKAAGARYSASDYLGAIAGFVQCLTVYEMNGHTEASIRGAILFNLGKAYEKAFETERETRYLRLARDTYVRYLNESAQGANYGDNDYVKLRLAEVERELAQLPDADQPASAAGRSAQPPSSGDPQALRGQNTPGNVEPVATARPAKKTHSPERLRRSANLKRRLGIGLMAGGGGGLVLGSSLIALGVVMEPGDTTDELTWEEEAAAAESLIYSGSFFVVMGVGMLVTGGILYGKGKRDLRRLQAQPIQQVRLWGMPMRGGLSAGLSGRF